MIPRGIDEENLKDLLKSAFKEALDDNQVPIRQIVEETIEDLLMHRAINEGLASEPLARDSVFGTLQGKN